MSDDQRDSPKGSTDDVSKDSSGGETSSQKPESETSEAKTKGESSKGDEISDSRNDQDSRGDQSSVKGEQDSDSSKYIKLRVVGNQDSNGINFRLKYTTALIKLKKSYSNHVGIPTSNLRFLFDGRRISDEDTPKQLDMSDDDQIEVYHEQTGGCEHCEGFSDS